MTDFTVTPMIPKADTRSILKRRLARAAVFLFVLFIGVHFALPQSCGAAASVSTPPARAEAADHADAPESGDPEEDQQYCTSHCAHLLVVGTPAAVVPTSPVSLAYDVGRNSVPSPHREALYRPPRRS